MVNKGRFLVAGAGGFLGRGVVAYLLSNGCSVVAADLNVDEVRKGLVDKGVELESVESRLELISMDITSEKDVVDYFSSASQLEGAVNCTYPRNTTYGASFLDVTLDSFNENVSLHLGGAFVLMRECARYYEKHKTPFSLVNISSIYGVMAPNFDVYEGTSMTMPVEYAAIKSAIIHLNRYVANFVSDSQFRVNSISPGGLEAGQPESFLAAYNKHCHGKGMLDVDDMMGGIGFLLSNNSMYINGQNIVIDDGFSL